MKNISFLLLVILVCMTSCKTSAEKKDLPADNSADKSKTEITQSNAISDNSSDNLVDNRFKFVIDDQIKDKQLDEKVKDLFEAIEEKIATGNFDGWYAALSYKYRKYISDKANLLSMSKESDYLYSRDVILQSPKDYFLQIVVPSRQGFTLKYLNFDYIDKNHIKVNCILDDNLKFVYDFTYEENSWKVDKK